MTSSDDRQRAAAPPAGTGQTATAAVGLKGRPGKGGHGRIYLGDRLTTMPALTHEIPPGLLSKILRDLGQTRRHLP